MWEKREKMRCACEHEYLDNRTSHSHCNSACTMKKKKKGKNDGKSKTNCEEEVCCSGILDYVNKSQVI